MLPSSECSSRSFLGIPSYLPRGKHCLIFFLSLVYFPVFILYLNRTAMVWTFSPNLYIETNPSMDLEGISNDIKRWALWEAIINRWWEQSPHVYLEPLYKSGPRELAHPFLCVRTQQNDGCLGSGPSPDTQSNAILDSLPAKYEK